VAKREDEYVPTYSSRGVGLHARRPGEATTAVPIAGFPSQSSYPRVKVEFHNPSGWVIKLEGVSHPREESGAAHTEVVLTGRVPESAALGTYDCTSVDRLTGDRKWAPIFEDPAFNIRVVQRPFHAQRGEEFLGLEPT
jgi:hypothetical protein